MLCEIRGLTKRYEQGEVVTPVSGVDLDIDSGEFIVISGESGVGKSTFLMMIAGLLRPTEGKIVYDGRDLSSLSDDELTMLRRKEIGYIFQTSRMIEAMTVEENIRFAVSMSGGARNKADELIEQVGLTDRRDYLPYKLSGGQLRRAMFVSLLARDPDLILADEPTNDLDEEWKNRIIKMLKHRTDEGGTVIAVAHDQSVAKYADRVYRMSDGKLIKI